MPTRRVGAPASAILLLVSAFAFGLRGIWLTYSLGRMYRATPLVMRRGRRAVSMGTIRAAAMMIGAQVEMQLLGSIGRSELQRNVLS